MEVLRGELKTFLVFLSLLSFQNFSFATEEDSSIEFLPEAWSSGLHLLAGGGFNTALYASNSRNLSMGIGLNIKTDVGYYFSNDWAIELGSAVKFNKLNDNVVWNTLFTLGLRYRLGHLSFLPFPNNLYVRAFYGRAPTVVFYEEEITDSGAEDDDDDDEVTTRIQFEGPVYGLSFGNFLRTEGGQVYFIELTGSAQHLHQEEKITMNGAVPEVISSNRVRDNSMIYALHVNIGILLF